MDVAERIRIGGMVRDKAARSGFEAEGRKGRDKADRHKHRGYQSRGGKWVAGRRARQVNEATRQPTSRSGKTIAGN